MIIYGSFKDPAPNNLWHSQINWANINGHNLREVIKYAKDYHIYNMNYGSAFHTDNLLYIICRNDSIKDIKNAKALWDASSQDEIKLYESLIKYKLYEIWWDIEDNWFAIIGLKNAKAYLKRVRWLSGL